MIANGYNWDGSTGSDKIAKSLAARTDWKAWIFNGTVGYDIGSNNRSGFTGLPGGGRDILGNFVQGSEIGEWWSSTEYVDDPNSVWMYSIWYDSEFMGKGVFLKNQGFSVRLIRDY
jgi:uncharacterized protein (TIGR02145 family)